MLILSDIHADTTMLFDWAHPSDFFKFSQEKYCIQLGDFGFWFSNKTNEVEETSLDYINGVLKENGKVLFTILGNHDCWPRYLKLETCNDWDFKTWKLRDCIYAIQPGEVVQLEGKTFLCIGGADSHDKEWRAEYEKLNGEAIWWAEETISDTDIETAKKSLEARDFKVDYVLTHCPPATFIAKANLYPNPIYANSEKKLDEILEIATFKEWLCGHVHKSCEIETGGKKITSLRIDGIVRI